MIDQDRVRARFAADRYAGGLGIQLVDVAEDSITVALDLDHRHANFHGATHGGVVFGLADCAFSLYANAYPNAASAIDTHLAFTAGSKPGDTLTAVATEVHRGRTLATYRVIVHRSDGKVIGHFTGTVFITDD